MFKIIRAARQILKSTKNIKDLAASSIKAIDKYLKPGKDQGYIEDVNSDFIFKKKISECTDLKVQDSFYDFGVVQKEGTIDWLQVRQLIYARFADEIGENKTSPIKVEAGREISKEFEGLRAQGYNFKKVSNLIEQKKGVVANDCVAGEGSNISSSSLIERMKKLSISGYLSNYAGDDGLRQEIEEVIIKKAACIDELLSIFGDNNGLSCCDYDGSTSVTLVGIEAM